MNCRAALPFVAAWSRWTRGPRQPAAAAGSASAGLPRRDDDAAASGCGWFDSSHDLARGLEWCEVDATALDAPLAGG